MLTCSHFFSSLWTNAAILSTRLQRRCSNFKIAFQGWGGVVTQEMAQQLRVLAALTRDQCSVPSANMVAQNNL